MFGVGPFSAMPEPEFDERAKGYKSSGIQLPALAPEEYTATLEQDHFDWRHEGKVSPIKDQNPCAVNWAFSATGTVESAYAIISGGGAPVLSVEQIIDCDGSGGCNSPGDVSQALQYTE